mmetsp:Transcript_14457/g.29792  ORF Transcript_14457/g.29792 Transcript_14457/m.29792 type:complete len:418 (-) Transcript_14457:69-1322(-)
MMTSASYCSRRISSGLSRTFFIVSAIKTTSVLPNVKNDGLAAAAVMQHRENQRGLVLLRKQPRRVTPEAATTATQHQQRRNSSSSTSPPMTAEEAGRKAAKLASEAIEQKNRLQQLLRAVDHVVDYDDNCDNDDSSGNSNTSMATLLSHAGIEVCRGGTSSSSNGAGLRENVPMSPPLHTATTYTRPADGIYKDGDSIYARMDNPTRLLLERCVFELECSHQMFSTETNIAGNIPTTTSFAFSSGMQAVTAILLAHSTSSAVPNNMTVLIPTDVYHGVRTLLSDVFSRHGVQVRELNMVTTRNNGSESDNDAGVVAIEKAISDIATAAAIEKNGKCGVGGNQTNGETNNRHNVIVWMETPSNPKCEVADIKAICEAARSAADLWSNVVDLTTVVDGTMASPVLTRPLEVRNEYSIQH